MKTSSGIYKMTKRIMALILVVIMTVILSACAGNAGRIFDPAENSSAADASMDEVDTDKDNDEAVEENDEFAAGDAAAQEIVMTDREPTGPDSETTSGEPSDQYKGTTGEEPFGQNEAASGEKTGLEMGTAEGEPVGQNGTDIEGADQDNGLTDGHNKYETEPGGNTKTMEGDEATLPKLENPTLTKPEAPALPKPEAQTLPKPEVSTLPKPEDPAFPKLEDPALPKPEDPTLPKPEDPTLPKPEDPTENNAGRKVLEGRIICIDPGHQTRGNYDTEPAAPGSDEMKAKVSSGTAGVKTGIPEYKLVLEVALKLRDTLEKHGATVIMTRTENNVDISNAERAAIANEANANLYFRIHADGSNDKSVHGVSVLIPGKKYITDENVLKESEKAGKHILDSFVKATGAKNRGMPKRNDLSGFNWCSVPMALIELGFMSNAEEDVKLNTKEYQDKMVEGMANGIVEYFMNE